MFEFTCPACHTTTPTAAVHSDKITLCPECDQHLCVVLADDEEAGESPGSRQQPPAPQPSGCASLWLVGASGACGVAGAVAIVLLWVFLGRGKALDPQPDPVAQGNDEHAHPVRIEPLPREPVPDTPPPVTLTKLEKLIGDLDNPAVEVRSLAAKQLGGMSGEDARPAASALVKALQDKQSRVRRDAAGALGRLGQPVQDLARAPLTLLLQDPEKDVRQAALAALPRLGKPNEAEPLKDMLANRTTPPEPRLYAVRALVDFGADALPALSDALSTDSDAAVAREAAIALGTIHKRTKEVGEALAKALDNQDRGVRLAAATSLGTLGLDATTLPGVLKALGSPDVPVRAAALPPRAAFGIGVVTSPKWGLTKEAVSSLMATLASPDPRARQLAAFALGTLGADAAGAAPELRAALAREQKGGLGIRRVPPDLQVEILATFAEIGGAALKALDPDGDSFLDELAGMLKGKIGVTRPQQTAAALALVKMALDKPQGLAALPRVADALLLVNSLNPDPVEKELHARARMALIAAGKAAVAPIAEVATAKFVDRLALTKDKTNARKATFEVLAEIGPDAKSAAVKKMIAYTVDPRTNAKEDKEVIEAAVNALNKVYGGN